MLSKINKPILRQWGKHQFHLVDSSPLPIITAVSVFFVVLTMLWKWHGQDYPIMAQHFWWIHSFFLDTLLVFSLLCWFIRVVMESNAGHHTPIVQQGLSLGMMLFIVSEVFFFFAFFWAFFHFSAAPSLMLGCTWPPAGLQRVDPWGLPLVNTLLLLSSGITITMAHMALLHSNLKDDKNIFLKHLFSTMTLGVTFLACQLMEYTAGVSFSWKDTAYGSMFFTTTGFHGFHVTFGTLFLCFCFVSESFLFLVMDKPYGMLYTIAYHMYRKSVAGMCHSEEYWKPQFYVKVGLGPLFKGLFKNKKIMVPYSLLYPMYYFLPHSIGRSMMIMYEPQGWSQALMWRKLRFLSYLRENWMKEVSTADQHLGFEAAAWYWHFVDVVWLFLFVTMYCWGN